MAISFDRSIIVQEDYGVPNCGYLAQIDRSSKAAARMPLNDVSLSNLKSDSSLENRRLNLLMKTARAKATSVPPMKVWRKP